MSTSTLYTAAATDQFLVSYNSVYATARAGSNLMLLNAFDTGGYYHLIADQEYGGGTYYCIVALLRFDTSGIPDDDVVSSATLALYPQPSYGVQGSPGSLEAYAVDLGASFGTEDWVAGADISGLTKLASIAAASFTTGAYRSLSSESAFLAAINRTGNTDILLCTSRFRTGDAPATELEGFYFLETEEGSSYRPRLTVEHAAAGISIPLLNHLLLGD
ncbi:MAG: hypothetical protein JW990_21215 [Thermoleophilia bacterium]|nr:hypothetical protein [Thermoleophilia bacterium]